MKTLKHEKARFDTRLPKEQKLFFERATRLGGFRSLTEFVILAAQEKAKKIISERDQVLASLKDSELFFNTITNSPKANDDLVSAVNIYKDFLSE